MNDANAATLQHELCQENPFAINIIENEKLKGGKETRQAG
jgi:hypothetical protein